MSPKALSILLLSVGCLALSSPFQAQAQQRKGITVVVENHSFFDMHVYALQSGQRRSLGLATGLSTRTFSLPRTLAESDRDIRILADPVGPRGVYIVDLPFLDLGEQVNLILESNLNLSQLYVTDQYVPKEKRKSPEEGEEAEGPRSGEATRQS